jgi:hypothetical protein
MSANPEIEYQIIQFFLQQQALNDAKKTIKDVNKND